MKRVFWALVHVTTVYLVVSGLFIYFSPTSVTSATKPKITIVQAVTTFRKTEGQPDPNVILEKVNQLRKAEGAEPLIGDPLLEDLATARAVDMLARTYYGHKDPDGRIFSDYLASMNISASYSCENLSLQRSKDELIFFDGWLHSKMGHKECMTDKNYTRAGYAVHMLYEQPDENGSVQQNYVVVAIHASAN